MPGYMLYVCFVGKKTDPGDNYLDHFINEFKELQTRGFQYNNPLYEVPLSHLLVILQHMHKRS